MKFKFKCGNFVAVDQYDHHLQTGSTKSTRRKFTASIQCGMRQILQPWINLISILNKRKAPEGGCEGTHPHPSPLAQRLPKQDWKAAPSRRELHKGTKKSQDLARAAPLQHRGKTKPRAWSIHTTTSVLSVVSTALARPRPKLMGRAAPALSK